MFTTFDMYKLVYMIELLTVFFIYARKFSRRKKFGWRVAAVCAINFLAAFFFPVPVYNSLYTSFTFLALFCLLLVTAIFCFEEKFINVLYCGLAAYTTRHMAFQIYGLATSAFNALFSQFTNDTATALYGNESFASFMSRMGFIGIILYVAVMVMACTFTFKFFGTRIWKKSNLTIKNSSLLILSGAAILIDVILYSILIYSLDSTTTASIIGYVYNVLCCLFIFYMMYNAIEIKSLNDELDMVKYLLKIQKENYEEQCKNIELINMRCHDIKHQIHEQLDDDAKKYLSGIEGLINIYDSQIKTGNNEMDIILMQKSLFCAKNDITFSCMVDGKKLSFMEGSDIYSLFGNIVDNAIESAIKFEDKDKRVIDLSVNCVGNILKVQSSNYYENEIEFDADGMPITTKKDKRYHGYGTKSMKAIVAKYGGHIEMTAKDGIFSVYIIMECAKLH